MDLATYGRFKETIAEYLKEKVPEIWHGDIPKVMETMNAFIEYLKVPFDGWDEQAEKCADVMIILYYGSEETKAKMRKVLRGEV